MANEYYRAYEMVLQQIVNKLTDEHGLRRVTVSIDGRLIKRYGTAYYQTRILKVSPKLLDYESELDNTLRHEVAHFMAVDKYNFRGHGTIWKECAVICGAIPRQYEPWKSNNELDGVRYIYRCPDGCKAYAAKIRRAYETRTCAKHNLRFTRFKVEEPI